MTGIAGVIFHRVRRKASLIERWGTGTGKVGGLRVIGQNQQREVFPRPAFGSRYRARSRRFDPRRSRRPTTPRIPAVRTSAPPTKALIERGQGDSRQAQTGEPLSAGPIDSGTNSGGYLRPALPWRRDVFRCERGENTATCRKTLRPGWSMSISRKLHLRPDGDARSCNVLALTWRWIACEDPPVFVWPE